MLRGEARAVRTHFLHGNAKVRAVRYIGTDAPALQAPLKVLGGGGVQRERERERERERLLK
jgi:hypothetical protein